MLYGLATVLLWSTVATAFKLALAELPPVQMLLVACVASVLVMGAILVAQGRWHRVFELSRKQYLQSIGMGLINPCLYYFFLFGAFDRLPAQEAQPLNYTWALVLAYLSVPFLIRWASPSLWAVPWCGPATGLLPPATPVTPWLACS
jgi:drug/metabolite transporter (DMT)-like permease